MLAKSNLKPFVRPNLDILFVGLNPAKGSSDKGHYFSVNQALWNQLHSSGLIIKAVDKNSADDLIFGSSEYNFKNWNYGITDLVTQFAESDSRKVKPTVEDCKLLISVIEKNSPKAVVLLHKTVLKSFMKYIGKDVPMSNSGFMGKLLKNSTADFYNIAFPHGNGIKNDSKVEHYVTLRKSLSK